MSLRSRIVSRSLWAVLALGMLALFSGYREPKYCRLSDKIFYPYCKYLCRTKGFSLGGFGGAMMDDIKKVNAYFCCPQILHVEDARKLYVEVMEGFIALYNANEAIRPYLHDYPMTAKNFDVKLSFRSAQEMDCEGHWVGYIFYLNEKDLVYYKMWDPIADKYITLGKESYATAKALAYGEKECSSCP